MHFCKIVLAKPPLNALVDYCCFPQCCFRFGLLIFQTHYKKNYAIKLCFHSTPFHC